MANRTMSPLVLLAAMMMSTVATSRAAEPPATRRAELLTAVPGEFVVKLRDNPDAQKMVNAMGADDAAHRPLLLSERERTYLVRPPKPEGVVGAFSGHEMRAALAASPAVAN